ncbi:MAG: glycoside hydrolase family 127 protein [Kiritimatiellaeota bacterium]|nr:glycoside hydrolase family 127 protein [Kiritimatiellota bacterium]
MISMKLPDVKNITVPDNLDLAWHAKLGINGLMGTIDPKVHYEPYFLTYYQTRPAYFLHWSSMVSGVQIKYLEALALMKCMTGATDIRHEEGFIKSIMDNVEEDGFIYDRALPERPWNVGVGYGAKSRNVDHANVAGNGRLVNGMWYYYQLTGDEKWKTAMRRGAEKIHDIAVVKNDYAYFPDPKCGNDFSWIKSGWPHTEEPGGPQEGVEGATVFYQTQPIRGLMKWLQVSGDERMLEMSKRLANFGMRKKFYGSGFENDPVAGAERGHTWGHWHGNMAAFRGLLDYAAVSGDARALEFVNDGYQWFRHHLTPHLGANNIDFESCCVGDWPALGIALSDAGMGDYWDDVDYAIRNAATQAQCLDADAYYTMGRNYAERPKDSKWGAQGDFRFTMSIALDTIPGLEDVEDVVERSMGGMCNCLQGRYQITHQMACCTANGLQGFYYGWEAAIRHDAGTSTVNLFYTRFSPWMDLISYLPYDGRVVIMNKTTKTLNVRIPGWVRMNDVRVTVNGIDATPARIGRYMRLDGLTGGECVEITFPQPRRSMEVVRADYNLRPWRWRGTLKYNLVGSTVIGFDDSGESSQGSEPTQIKLYEHPGYYKNFRSGKYAEKSAPYYVPEKIIRWY